MREWTQEEDDRLREIVMKQDLRAREIAALFGRTTNSIIGRVHRLGLYLTEKRPVRPAKLKPIPIIKSSPLPVPKMIEFDKVTLMELKGNMCHWPVNHGGPFLFCGREKHSPIVSYCDHHNKISLQPRRR